jgi:lipopolysaccharide/colanic/teichoic acid biosynthesis glycosyltransferase
MTVVISELWVVVGPRPMRLTADQRIYGDEAEARAAAEKAGLRALPLLDAIAELEDDAMYNAQRDDWPSGNS